MKCKGTTEGVDQNTLDMTGHRKDGHRFLRSLTYKDGSYDARCLKCGVFARIRDGRILESW